ncbi:hypothetical protein PuT2_13995 [Pusillimonas sp. T2]|uniref:phage Gp37/Gp68 family protein n=1 Tax=Pusillimonas sp. T2 TaxID=1548123 RepID=UPI000B8E6C2C|nr:phage Gp37/Gp68 family protein [Pusillimonas sp. T2]OXR48132.1 hypothetical protein PuT2_13995 [Pusillimonas sp. T2]
MSENTKIEWCDHTFNPWIGCTKVGPGCDNCYAEADFDKRRHVVSWGAGQPRKRTAASTWRNPLAWNRNHEQFFAKHGRRQRVFCASLADVFDNAVDPQWRADLFRLIEATPNLDWLLLTKRIGNVPNMLPLPFDFDRHFPNVWIGATVVSQQEADRDIPKLLQVPARVRFLSMEPLLGPVDVEDFLYIEHPHCIGFVPSTRYDHGYCDRCAGHESDPIHTSPKGKVDWVIVGGESGPGARPMHPDWARSLRDQCQAAGVPFLFKQWGEWAPHPEIIDASQGALFHRFEDGAWMQRDGKKAAGRMLDGCTWDQFPDSLEKP